MIDYTNQNVCANCLHCKVKKNSGDSLEKCKAFCSMRKWGTWITTGKTKDRFIRGLAEGPHVTNPFCNVYDPIEPPGQERIVLRDIMSLRYQYNNRKRLTSKA